MQKRSNLIHIRVGEEIKQQLRRITKSGKVSTEAEIVREGIKEILQDYQHVENEE